MKHFLFVLVLSISVFSCSKDDSDSNNGLIGSWELKKEYVYNEPIDTINGELEIDTILYEEGLIMTLMDNDTATIVDGISTITTGYIHNEDEDLLYLVDHFFFNIEKVDSDSLIVNRSIWEVKHRFFYTRIDD